MLTEEEKLQGENELLLGAIEVLKRFVDKNDVKAAQKRYKHLDKLVRGTELEKAFILGLEHPDIPLCHERIRLGRFLIVMNALP